MEKDNSISTTCLYRIIKLEEVDKDSIKVKISKLSENSTLDYETLKNLFQPDIEFVTIKDAYGKNLCIGDIIELSISIMETQKEE